MEVRKFNKCEAIIDGDNILKVTWDIYRDDTYSHSYEQFYTKESKDQFITDIGITASEPFMELFD